MLFASDPYFCLIFVFAKWYLQECPSPRSRRTENLQDCARDYRYKCVHACEFVCTCVRVVCVHGDLPTIWWLLLKKMPVVADFLSIQSWPESMSDLSVFSNLQTIQGRKLYRWAVCGVFCVSGIFFSPSFLRPLNSCCHLYLTAFTTCMNLIALMCFLFLYPPPTPLPLSRGLFPSPPLLPHVEDRALKGTVQFFTCFFPVPVCCVYVMIVWCFTNQFWWIQRQELTYFLVICKMSW